MPGGNPVMELLVFGNRPRLPVTMVAPVFVIAELAMIPKGAAVPRSIWASAWPENSLRTRSRYKLSKYII
jgi:hypothetical protein